MNMRDSKDTLESQEAGEHLLQVTDLKTHFFTRAGTVEAVDGVSFSLDRGVALGIVGESGSGKTVTALSLMRLVPKPGRIVGGHILLNPIGDLTEKSERDMEKIRGKNMSMAFQDPMTFLNPVMKVGDQITEAILLHQNIEKPAATRIACETMNLVGIPSPETRMLEYPHQMSGGMRQRILLAIGLSCDPDVLIADEITTALDAITQAKILRLLKDLRSRFGMALVLITHDLGVVAQLAERLIVMYAGRIMEMGSIVAIFKNPRNPYTQALLELVPRIDHRRGLLPTIDGSIPRLILPPSGCRFHPRCPRSSEICRKHVPDLKEIERQHLVACWNA